MTTEKISGKTAALRTLLIKAWRERWSASQYGTQVPNKSYIFMKIKFIIFFHLPLGKSPSWTWRIGRCVRFGG